MRPRLFLDTNIVLDLLGERSPYYDSIAKIVTLAERGEISLVASAMTYAIVFYLLSKYEHPDQVKEKLRKFRILSEISDLDASAIEKGLNSKFDDFEDSLQYYCALKSNCVLILTRNQKDFKEAAIPVLSADEYLVSIRK